MNEFIHPAPGQLDSSASLTAAEFPSERPSGILFIL